MSREDLAEWSALLSCNARGASVLDVVADIEMHALVASVVLWLGRPRTTRIPSDTHQADRVVIPSRARVDANGGPLSTCMVFGSPYLSKTRSNSALTTTAPVLSINCAHSTYRVAASRTVSGSQRAPSFEFHHPLKSTVHQSFGASQST